MSNVVSRSKRLEPFKYFIELKLLGRLKVNTYWLVKQIKAIHRNGKDEKE